jgi:RNA ligase
MEDLDRLISLGYISKRKHPSQELFILNYTAKTQYERFWNETTMSCRGLIVDSSGGIRARCFKKFFNYEEVASEVARRISESVPFRSYEKMDGSLGVLYWVGDEPFIATRGSFDSPQARRANELLRSRPRPGLRRDMTYLLEIVYPDNRICVDYGSLEDLFLLSVVDTETGREVFDLSSPFSRVEEVGLDNDFGSIRSRDEPNREGFVVRFDDGFRFKIKFEQYVRLHSAIFSVSSKSLWRCLMENENIPLDMFPDEIYGWVSMEKRTIESSYRSIVDEASSIFSSIKSADRKEFARRALEYSCSPILFAMLDGKPYDNLAWRMVEPEYRTPFDEKIQKGTQG